MSLSSTPRWGHICDVQETVPVSATQSTPSTRNVTIGTPGNGGITNAIPATLSIGTGTAQAINNVIDGAFTLAGAGTLTIDLSNFNSGAKVFAKCRGFKFVNTGAADAGAGFAFTASATASNGFTAGGQIPPSTAPATVMPNSEFCGDNLNSVGWTVNGTNKTVIITAGASGATGYFVFIGE